MNLDGLADRLDTLARSMRTGELEAIVEALQAVNGARGCIIRLSLAAEHDDLRLLKRRSGSHLAELCFCVSAAVALRLGHDLSWDRVPETSGLFPRLYRVFSDPVSNPASDAPRSWKIVTARTNIQPCNQSASQVHRER